MFSFEFSYVNLAIAILLLLISLFLTFIYQANLQIKYRKVNIKSRHSALKQGQNILASKNEKAYIKFNGHYLKSAIRFDKKIITIDYNATISMSIYDQANLVFLAYKYLLAKNNNQKMINYQGFFNCLIAFFAFNLLWSLILSFYIVVIISATLWLIFGLLMIIYHYPLEKRAKNLTLNFLTPLVKKTEQKKLKSYAKYLSYACFFELGQVYSLTLKSLIINFKNWGHNE